MSFKQSLSRAAPAALTALVPLLAPIAAAQNSTPPQSVERTAQAGEDTQLLPAFRWTLTEAELQKRGTTSLDGVAEAIPELTLVPSVNSSNTPLLYMRGQGLDAPGEITRDPAVGVYQDGFRIARPQALTFQVPALQEVDVRSGPQGATYGPNTTGGVVNLLSSPPAGELRLKQSVDFGNRNMFRVVGSADTPAWHDLSAKLTLLASSVDGYVKNTLPNSHNYGEEVQQGGRLQLRWNPAAQLRADYFLERINLSSTPDYDTNPYLNGQPVYSSFFFYVPYYANPNGPTTTTYRPIDLALSTSNHVAHGLTLTWQPAQALTIRSLTGYRTMAADDRQDYAEYLGTADATNDLYRTHQFSEELRFDGTLPYPDLSFAGAVSYFREGGYHDRTVELLLQQRSFDTRVFATSTTEFADAQLQWRPGLLHGQLRITGAVGYGKGIKDAERFEADSALGILESGAINRLSYRRLNPAFGLSYGWTPDISTYATFTTGYRAGGALELAPSGQFATSTLQPESIQTYEVGSQAAWLNGHLRGRAALFGSRYKQIQDPISIDLVTDAVYSIKRASLVGANLDLTVEPVTDLTLNGSIAALRWRIDEADVIAGSPLDPQAGYGSTYVLGQNLKSLFALQYAPRYNFTVGADYAVLRWSRGDLAAHLDYVYRGRVYSNAAAGPAVPGGEFETIPGYGLLNGRLTYTQLTDWSRRVKISLWGRNLLHRKYYALTSGYGAGVSSFQTSSSGVAAPVGWQSQVGAWAEPASYGVYASYEY